MKSDKGVAVSLRRDVDRIVYRRHLLSSAPRVISAVREMRGRLKHPPKNVDEFLRRLHQQGLPQAVSRLSDFSDAR